MASSPLDVSFETVGSALEEEDRVLDDVVASAALLQCFRALCFSEIQLHQPVLIGDPNYAGTTDAIDAFARPDIRDERRPLDAARGRAARGGGATLERA